jgi:hypothetical protein
MAPLQRDLHDQLRREALANHERLASAVRSLDPEQLVRRPAPTAWSVGEVLEHLCVAEDLFARPTATLIHRARPDAAAPLREWKPSFLGNRIAASLANPRLLKAPRILRPRPTPRNGVVEDFLARDTRLVHRMDEAASLDWNALRISPPMLPPLLSFLKINLGDVFNIHVVHVRRHLGQVERVIAAIGKG